MRSGGNARADTGGARTSGDGGNHASRSGGGAARTSVNRDFSIASLNTPPTRSTTTQRLDSANLSGAGFSSVDGSGANRVADRIGNYDLDYDVDDHWHPAAGAAVWARAAGFTTVPIGSIAYTLAPTCTPTHVNTITYFQCGSVWFQPQFAGTTVTYVAVDDPR